MRPLTAIADLISISRYTTTKTQSLEEFTSASGNVKPGLIASGIVSAWTWAVSSDLPGVKLSIMLLTIASYCAEYPLD